MRYRSNTATAVESASPVSLTGSLATFVVTVASGTGGDRQPEGLVSLWTDRVRLGRAALTLGVATMTVQLPGPGVRRIHAQYEGDSYFNPSEATVETDHVVKLAGYWLLRACGAVYPFGDVGYHGSLVASGAGARAVAMASTTTGRGYWILASDGTVHAFGDAPDLDPVGGRRAGTPIGIAAAPGAAGFWVAMAEGAVVRYGDAADCGTLDAPELDGPVSGIAASADAGYLLTTTKGRVLACRPGSRVESHDLPLAAAAVGVAAGGPAGCWVAGADGSVVSPGGVGEERLELPVDVTSIAACAGTAGYWLGSQDGGVFAFGGVGFYGSLPGEAIPADDVVCLAAPA